MSNDKTGNSKSVIGRLIALLVSVIVLFLAMRFLPVQQWLRNFNDWVSQMGVVGVFIFIGVYALARSCSLPDRFSPSAPDSRSVCGKVFSPSLRAQRSARLWLF